MSFIKAKNEQSVVKCLLYGAQGSGKTLTALDIAEGLTKKYGGRIAMIATERGYDFYTQPAAGRKLHPSGFDFDVSCTKSFLQASRDVDEFIRSQSHTVLIVDSLTQVHEACKENFGQKNSIGAIKRHLWNKINLEYNLFIEKIVNCPKHIILCGRSSNLYEDSEKSGESVVTGTQPRVGKDTGYEAHIVIRMEQRMDKGQYKIVAVGEKDRTSTIVGRVIDWPNFHNTVEPTLSALGLSTVGILSNIKNDIIEMEEKTDIEDTKSKTIRDDFLRRISACNNVQDLKSINKEIKQNIPGITREDLEILRSARNKRQNEFSSQTSPI